MSEHEQVKKDTVFSLRLSPEEFALVERGARKYGISVSEYMRKSIALSPLKSVLEVPQVAWIVSTPSSQCGQVATQSENRTLVSQLHLVQKGCI